MYYYHLLKSLGAILGRGIPRVDSKQKNNFKQNIKMYFDGKEQSLYDISVHIDKLYSSLTTGYAETILFSLIDMTSL
jgi:hypothetical protein